MRAYIEARHLWGLGIAIIVAAAVSGFSYQDWREYEDFNQQVEQSRGAVQRAEHLLADIKEAESGERGYVVTGDPMDLHRYEISLGVVRQDLVSLEPALSKIGAAGVARDLANLVTDRLDDLAVTVEARRRGDLAGASRMIGANRGLKDMDALREDVLRIVEAEAKRAEALRSVRGRHVVRTHLVNVVGNGVLALIILAVTIRLNALLRVRERLISTLKESHRGERQQKAILQTTLRSIGDAVITTDRQGRVVFMNPVAENLTGRKATNAAGQPLDSVFPIIAESTREPLESPAKKVLRERVVTGLDNRALLIGSEGAEIPIEDSAAPIAGNGPMSGVVLVFRDVTARRKAQQLLEASELRYRLLFEGNPQPLWVYDLETLAFLAVNQAAIERYGYTREEFLGMTLRDIRPEEDVPALLADVGQPTFRRHTDGPWRHRKKDGSLITVEITASPITLEGRPACIVMPTDISERVRLQEQLWQAQKLEAIGQLAGGVAHDFNNLLTIVIGYGRLLYDDQNLGPAGRAKLEQIMHAADRATALTAQLLAFSRRSISRPRVANVNHLVRDTHIMLGRIIGEGVELDTALSVDLGNARIDPGQFEQVLVNLVINARDAMPGGGRIFIETANVELNPNYARAHVDVEPGPYVMLAVTDTGSGMDEATKARIFEPFFTTKGPGKGTGLGLATVYGIVKQSGGNIWVYSEVGKGTTFKVYLPRVFDPADSGSAVQPQSAPNATGAETILLVENDDDLRKLARDVLVDCGYTVLEAPSGNEALDLCRRYHGRIHLLLTDVVMPRLNGKELAQRLLQLYPTLRVVFMTGFTEGTVLNDGTVEGEIDLIEKPFTPESLSRAIREVLDRGRKLAVLVLDQDEPVRKFLRATLERAGHEVIEASDGRQGSKELRHRRFGLLVTGLAESEQEGLSFIREARRSLPDLKVVAISNVDGGEYLRTAEAFGAHAALRKPLQPRQLLDAIENLFG